MAAITLGNSTVSTGNVVGDMEILKIVTPATADSADTVDITDIVNGRDVSMITCWDRTTGDAVTATYNSSTEVITLDASGGTTDHTYAILVHVN